MGAMSDIYPDDADGDALRRVASTGANMSLPMDIDFFVAVPGREAGEAVAQLASRAGFSTELVYDEEDDAWECVCTKRILPTYGDVVGAQRELDEMSRPFGGHSDGWGTLANLADT
jgi:hypothetical protein